MTRRKGSSIVESWTGIDARIARHPLDDLEVIIKGIYAIYAIGEVFLSPDRYIDRKSLFGTGKWDKEWEGSPSTPSHKSNVCTEG
jgi:hypothetical protein